MAVFVTGMLLLGLTVSHTPLGRDQYRMALMSVTPVTDRGVSTLTTSGSALKRTTCGTVM